MAAPLLQKPVSAFASLRAHSPWRVLHGFGRAVRAACRYCAPQTVEELAETLQRASVEGLSVAFRGAGRSYGDAALNAEGLVIDMSALRHMLRWEPESGVMETQPGLTIEDVWRRTIADGFWPAVVPGTMRPTLGGCVSMNVHGKNNFKAGPFGDHVLEIDLLTPRGELMRCSRDQNADVFHAAIGGLGLLGVITRVKLRLTHVDSGLLRVQPITTRHLDETFDAFEARLPTSDYLVGWIDCFATGQSLGRGVLHAANYLKAGEDPDPESTLKPENQALPSRLMGLPRSSLWRIMRLMTNDPGISFVNALKYQSSWWEHGKSYLQSHVAFAFLLDYVPGWRLAYGRGGFIQYQMFVPHESARACLREVLERCQKAGIRSYLGVLKRHRPDNFLLSHALDGWSLALDFRVTEANRQRLWALTDELTERVLDAGGTFYFAKDAVLTADQVRRAYGERRVRQFVDIKSRLDPQGLLANDLWRRAIAHD
jgi:decaprenylphospho-beta-D-ribofuranose 2-oxidase